MMKEFALAIDKGGYGQVMNRIPSLGITNFMYVYRNETDENRQANVQSASMPRVSMMWEKSYGLLLPSIRLALPQSCSRLVPFDPNILHLVPSDTLKSVREDIVNHVNAAEHVEFTTVYLQEGFA